jgi:RNA polymerase sigma factor (TIGR02999 family)
VEQGVTPEPQQITGMLRQFAAGDKSALDRLMPLVYAELRRLAGSQLRRERDGITLQPTALVHEAYARLIDQDQPDFRNRAHFLGVAAKLMREILIDSARRRNAAKRGGGQINLSLDEALDGVRERSIVLIALDQAMRTLERKDPLKARLVEMRFFGGLTAEEMAEITEISVNSVRAELRIAQAWLRRRLGPVPSSKK